MIMSLYSMYVCMYVAFFYFRGLFLHHHFYSIYFRYIPADVYCVYVYLMYVCIIVYQYVDYTC